MSTKSEQIQVLQQKFAIFYVLYHLGHSYRKPFHKSNCVVTMHQLINLRGTI